MAPPSGQVAASCRLGMRHLLKRVTGMALACMPCFGFCWGSPVGMTSQVALARPTSQFAMLLLHCIGSLGWWPCCKIQGPVLTPFAALHKCCQHPCMAQAHCVSQLFSAIQACMFVGLLHMVSDTPMGPTTSAQPYAPCAQ